MPAAGMCLARTVFAATTATGMGMEPTGTGMGMRRTTTMAI